MKNCEKINLLKSTIQKTAFGTVTTLIAEFEISVKKSISFGEKTLLANYIYYKNGNYKLVYTIIGNEGNDESFIENDGILPTLFLNPNQENYVSIIPYHPDKKYEISVPIFNRENTELPKGNRPFVGDFIGTSKQFSIFYNVDNWSDMKPDKMLVIEFKNNIVIKKHNIKITLPRNNKIFIDNNEIHLLAKFENVWLHRQIDEQGNMLHERKLETNQKIFKQILSLSFNKNSYLLALENGKIIIEKIDQNGKGSTIELIDIKDHFYNTWQPVKIAESTFVTKFNSEFGNGWFTVKDDKLIELFYSKGEQGYKNWVNQDILHTENENLVISSINRTNHNSYAVIFYPMINDKSKNKKIIIFNREI